MDMDKTLGMALLAALPLMGSIRAGEAREEQERALILEHIHGIFRAYLDADRAALRRMHTTDWTGFQGPSTRIERGIEDYMRNAELSLETFRGTGYELLDTEVQLHGSVALVYYVARYDYVDGQGRTGSLALRSIDVYRKEDGLWNQCGSHITPIPRTGSWGEGAD
jgi:ketosteroid isomerase-like protein